MELDQLNHLIKIAELKSITRAADELRLSQPAVSRSLQRLEDEFGLPLFERQSRGMSLTEAGKMLYQRAKQILALVDDTKTEIADNGQSGNVRIGAIPTIAPYFLPKILQRFGQEFPKARVMVQEEVTSSLIGRVSQGEIDIAILALPIQGRYLEVLPLFDEELLLVLPVDHPLNLKKQIRVNDVREFPFVLLDEAHCLSDNISSFCRQRNMQLLSIERTSQLATVQELVALNHGISMIPEMARLVDDSSRRVYRSFAGEKPTRTVVAVWNPYRFQSKLQLSFLNLLKRSKP